MNELKMMPQQQLKMTQPNPPDGRKPLSAQQLSRIDAAAQDFEAMYLTEMLRPMFEDVNKPDPTFGGGKGEEIFNGMMLDHYGKIMASAGGVGIAKFVRDEMIKIQQEATKQ